MTSKKDMRREDLIIPYIPPDKEEVAADMSSNMAQMMPMAALFSRQKMIAWVALVFTIQNWLSEPPDRKNPSGTPAIFSVVMSVIAIGTAYLPLFLPPPGPRGGTVTGADPPQAPSHT